MIDACSWGCVSVHNSRVSPEGCYSLQLTRPYGRDVLSKAPWARCWSVKMIYVVLHCIFLRLSTMARPRNTSWPGPGSGSCGGVRRARWTKFHGSKGMTKGTWGQTRAMSVRLQQPCEHSIAIAVQVKPATVVPELGSSIAYNGHPEIIQGTVLSQVRRT